MPIGFVEGPHYPRYYFADQIVTIRDREDFVEKLSTSDVQPTVAFIPRPSFVPAAAWSSLVTERANTARLESSVRAGLPGDERDAAQVLDHPRRRIAVPAIMTNIAYQGIIVTPGRHHVEMRYRNELWSSVSDLIRSPPAS